MRELYKEKICNWHSSYHLLPRWFSEPISSTLKIEAMCSCETSVETQRTTRRHIPDYDTLHSHRCENFKSYIICPRHQMLIGWLHQGG
jgi:hypothetical protein